MIYHGLADPDSHDERLPHHCQPAAPEERSELLAPGGFIRGGERGETGRVYCRTHCPPLLCSSCLLVTPADQINVIPALSLLARNYSQGLVIPFVKRSVLISFETLTTKCCAHRDPVVSRVVVRRTREPAGLQKLVSRRDLA